MPLALLTLCQPLGRGLGPLSLGQAPAFEPGRRLEAVCSTHNVDVAAVHRMTKVQGP